MVMAVASSLLFFRNWGRNFQPRASSVLYASCGPPECITTLKYCASWLICRAVTIPGGLPFMNRAVTSCPELMEEDFVYAMKDMNTYIDVIPGDLVDFYRLVCKYADTRHAEGILVRDVTTFGLISIASQHSLADADERICDIVTHTHSVRAVLMAK